MRADLTDPGTVQLANAVRKACVEIPRQIPEKELSQAEAEQHWRRDRLDSATCADASLGYVNHIETRDQALTRGRKKS